MKAIGYYPEQFLTKAEQSFIKDNPASPLATAAKRIAQACEAINNSPTGIGEAMIKQNKKMLTSAVQMKNTKSQFSELILL